MTYSDLAVQFIKFGFVGGINTTVSLVIYYLFLRINPELYLLGNIVGFLIATLNAYYWNDRFVFRDKTSPYSAEKSVESVEKELPQSWTKLIKTYISYGLSLGLSTALLYFWVQVIDISKTIAPAVNLVITIPLNFCMNRFWVYKK